MDDSYERNVLLARAQMAEAEAKRLRELLMYAERAILAEYRRASPTPQDKQEG